jgi:CBS domain-containing protein
MSVQSILNHKGTNVVTIRGDTTIKDAADLMHEHRIAALVVRNSDTIIGVISERDVVTAISRFGATALSMTVKEVAARAIAIAPDDSLKRAMSLMTTHRVRHLPVIANGKLEGIVSIGDVVKHRLEDLEMESNVLRDTYFIRH